MSTAVPPNPMAEAQRLELLLDSVTEYAMSMLDVDGVVTSWYVGAERITGYPSGEVLGQHFSRFFTPEDRARGLPARILREARLNGRFESEGWRLRRNGGRFWGASVTQPVYDPSGALIGFAEITRDITERQAAENALRESERRFRLLVEGVVDYAIYMLDASGVVTNWNLGAERMKGYTADEIIGQHFSRFYTREDRAGGLPARVLETAAREGRHEAEGWRVRKDGSRFWASVVIDAVRDERGDLIGFAKITRDITERRAAQEALRDSERQFRLLIRGVTDYALFMLDPNGVITSWNPGAERIKGYTAEEILGQHFSRFYTERDRAAGLPARALRTAAEEGRFEAESWRVRKDGTLFWANVIIDPIRDESGTLVGFAKITRDITERRAAQAALDEARAQRDHAQKMEVLGQLTGGVAHDFNNLLMIFTGHVERLKRLAGDDQQLLRIGQALEQTARRGEALTRQLLTFARRQTLNPQVVEVGARIEALRTMLASTIGSAVKLIADIPPLTWPIKVDVNEFELALVNLALNARDAMPQGGVVTITAENVRLEARDTPARLEGEFVAISLTDTGSGIPPDILPKVFDPFFTTKRVDKGSGLGLSQVHGFVHQSGGTVVVDSTLGRGTRVTLYLPRTSEASQKRDHEPAVEYAGGGRVLVVEDNPEVAEVSAALLEQLGYEVEAAANADAALAAIERSKFDLVVSDIVMPGTLDGVGLARRLRDEHPELPVILVTGYSSDPGLATEFALLRKPYQLAALSRAAAKAIAESRQGPPSNLVHLRDARQARGERRGE